jgi:signal transduction histidine kinase
MSASRPLPWVSSVIYGAVLLAGLYANAVDLGQLRLAQFLAGLGALAVLDLVEHRRYPRGTPRRTAVVLFAARVMLFVVVGMADGSGSAWVLLVLVPFDAYFAFGRVASISAGLTVVAAIVVGNVLTVPGWYAQAEPVSDLLMFSLGLILSTAMAAAAVDAQRGQTRLARSHERLVEYARQVAELSQTAERNRVARDIHDGLGHHLTAISVLLEKVATFADRDPQVATQALDDARRSARLALEDVRRSVHTLRSETPFRLSAALTDLVRSVDGEPPEVHVDLIGDEDGYSTASLTALYRAAQESLTNVRRHAAATRVSVRLSLDGDRAELVVADDGRGFQPHREGFGLRGMRERVELLGGDVRVDSRPGAGTRITVTVPRTVALDSVVPVV